MTPDPTGAFCVVGAAIILGALLGNLHAPHRPETCWRCLLSSRPLAVLAGAAVLGVAVYYFGLKRRA